MRISDWSSDVCSSDLREELACRLGCGRGYSGTLSMNEVAAASAAPKRRTYFRRSTEARLLPDQVGRQGQITHLAFRLLGRETAIAFLHAHPASLGSSEERP